MNYLTLFPGQVLLFNAAIFYLLSWARVDIGAGFVLLALISLASALLQIPAGICDMVRWEHGPQLHRRMPWHLLAYSLAVLTLRKLFSYPMGVVFAGFWG